MDFELSQGLADSISQLTKIAVLSKEDKREISLSQIYRLLDKLVLNSEREVQRLVENEKFEDAASRYALASLALEEVVPVLNNREISNLLDGLSLSLSARAVSVLKDGVHICSEKALILEKRANNKESTEYKNMAEGLRYKIDHGIANKAIKKKAADYMQTLRQEKRSEVQSETTIADRGLRAVRGWTNAWSPKEEYESPFDSIQADTLEQKPAYEGVNSISPDEIKIDNDSKKSANKEGWYDWSVYVLALPDVLKQIKSVRYTLHHSFHNPVQEVSEPRDSFRLRRSGWGEFEIKLDIQLKNGDSMTKYHWLDLDRPPRNLGALGI